MIDCYIALGSNLNDPRSQLEQAIQSLKSLPHSKFIKRSYWYHSLAVGYTDQPDFINGVALIQTQLAPLELLDHLQDIEQQQGRVRHIHWGPRTLDLDLILYGQEEIDHPRLVVPHIQLKKRRFVLEPLHEITPNLFLPNQEKISQLLEKNKEKIFKITS